MSGKNKKKITIEIACYNPVSYEELQKICYLAIYHKLNSVCVPSYLVEKTKPLLIDGVKCCCLVDFPYGYSTIDIKHHAIIKACRQGASIIELTINNGLIINKEFDKLHNELKTSYELCKANKVEFRVSINYRDFEQSYLVDLSSALAYSGIDAIVTNTGNLPDDPLDNIIAANKIEKSTGINVIASSPFFSAKHKELIEKSSISGMRILNYNIAKDILGSDGV